jgi:UDP-N-acetylmuramoyl-L-alanyl-D-glutamate--2,6-diaminopimelate ligase
MEGLTMKLSDLLSSLHICHAKGNLDIEVKGIETDSRKVKPGYLFIALRGFTVDGHQYVGQAAANGAVAFLVEGMDESVVLPGVFAIVPDTRRALAVIADRFYHHPTRSLNVIGVTGTNGKTSITYLIEQMMKDAGHKSGIIGTIQMRIGDYTEEVSNTTPESIQLQKWFSLMLDKGADHACIEVSSHALEMGRVRGCNFRTAIFTNLTQDHLDYHQTMENYRNAKSLLFSQLGNTYNDSQMKFAILNADDEASEYYSKVTSAQVIYYGIDREADVRALDIKINESGTDFLLQTYKGSIPATTKMVGKFSVYNVLAATAACLAEGIPLSSIQKSLESISGVQGRFERVDEGQDYTVIVDYAHTPDSLKNVLETAKEFTKGDIYCIIGCGGDRDRTKRPIMARIAVEHARYAIFTSDNPRSEEPDHILQDMINGVKGNPSSIGQYTAIIDRKEAIEDTISKARQGDCVIIAGKGHETYQIMKGQTLPFDDKQVASAAIQSRLKR